MAPSSVAGTVTPISYYPRALQKFSNNEEPARLQGYGCKQHWNKWFNPASLLQGLILVANSRFLSSLFLNDLGLDSFVTSGVFLITLVFTLSFVGGVVSRCSPSITIAAGVASGCSPTVTVAIVLIDSLCPVTIVASGAFRRIVPSLHCFGVVPCKLGVELCLLNVPHLRHTMLAEMLAARDTSVADFLVTTAIMLEAIISSVLVVFLEVTVLLVLAVLLDCRIDSCVEFLLEFVRINS